MTAQRFMAILLAGNWDGKGRTHYAMSVLESPCDPRPGSCRLYPSIGRTGRSYTLEVRVTLRRQVLTPEPEGPRPADLLRKGFRL